ncbi:MLO-like protein 13 isoform X2 [Momordica charantia]|uniref:MLO-like protein n=1 Tax=Momordica charantia TaxID=3673 RepID=A0A6J1D4C2_MOMCH|nr:MLO-like protein 13 isoform X2 [Momordica charantia]
MEAEGGFVVHEPPNAKFEFTPTWIVAVVCSIIVLISFCAERGLHHLGKWLQRKGQDALYDALQKLKEELMILGFISLLLTVSQGAIGHFCMPPDFANYMLPCKRNASVVHHFSSSPTFIGDNNIGRRLLSTQTNVQHCSRKGKVPLLSLEALHQLHIFIFVLAVVHVIFCATTMLLAAAKIRLWKSWEDSIPERGVQISRSGKASQDAEFVERAQGFWRKAAVIGWVVAFVKQFHGSITKSDYISLRRGFIEEHCPRSPNFDFYGYVTRTLENDFKKVVGIRMAHLFLVVISTTNLGAKLEFIITRMAQELNLRIEDKEEQKEQEQKQEHQRTNQTVQHKKKKHFGHEVKPSDEHFWFARPSLVLLLIHFILFQNSFEIAFFFWIWTTYGFKSCIMEKAVFVITRLFLGALVQVLCSYSTLPLYTLVTQMGSTFKKGMFGKTIEELLISWAKETRRKREAAEKSEQSQRSTHHDIASTSQPSSQVVQIPPIHHPSSSSI